MSPDEVTAAFPDLLGSALMRHAFDEMTMLSRLLPQLYIAENRDRYPVELPW
jgi:hypothetical protein